VSGIVVERAEPGVEVIIVTGEHDISTAPELERRLEAALESGHAVVIDLLGTTFIDSTVLRVLICAREEAGERSVGFRCELGESTGHGVRRLLDLTGMAGRLQAVPTRADAIAGAAAPGHA
jgi:anti-anti-sigma factor